MVTTFIPTKTSANWRYCCFRQNIYFLYIKLKKLTLKFFTSATEINPARTLGLGVLLGIIGGVHIAKLHRYHINLEKGVLGKGKGIPDPADNLAR